MKIIMLCGSSSPQNSTSFYLLEELKKKLISCDITIIETAKMTVQSMSAQIISALNDCDALVIAYSLYVDAVPAHLLEILKDIETRHLNKDSAFRVYQVINNGFYEAVQNTIAIDMVWKWCEKCHFEIGCAVSVGAGPMVKVAPLGYGPSANLGKAMNRLAEMIIQKQFHDTIYVEPNYPRFLYRLQFDLSWVHMAKQNGLKKSALKHRQI